MALTAEMLGITRPNEEEETDKAKPEDVACFGGEDQVASRLKKRAKIKVTLEAKCGCTITVNLVVDSGSGASILPVAMYKRHFSHVTLDRPGATLYTFARIPMAVLGCLELKVICNSTSATKPVHVVPVGPPILGLDLLQALRLDVDGDGELVAPKPSRVMSLLKSLSVERPMPKQTIHCNIVPLRCEVKPGEIPLRQGLCRFQASLRSAVSRELRKLEEEGIIERIDSSPWVSPLFAVRHKTGRVRLRADLRETNRSLELSPAPMPSVEEVFHELRGAGWFSTIDLQNLYLQIPLDPDSRNLTAFITHDGLFRYTKVPYGLAAAPAAFQTISAQAMASLDGVLCYLNYIIVHSDNFDLHLTRLDAVLRRLGDCGLKLSTGTCQLVRKQITLLGHVFSASGVRLDPQDTAAFSEAPPPRSVAALQSFLNASGMYKKYFPNYASHVEPLNALLKKTQHFQWNDEAQEAYCWVKELLAGCPDLSIFDPTLQTFVTTDTSEYGIGAVLTQVHRGKEKPVAFASCSLSPYEKKFTVTERSVYACVLATEKWYDCLWGIHFTLRTNHMPLITMLSSTEGLARGGILAMWSTCLMSHHYTMMYNPGPYGALAECLAHIPLPFTGSLTKTPLGQERYTPVKSS